MHLDNSVVQIRRHVPFGHLRSLARPVTIGGVICEECEVEAEGDAQGWEAYLADLDDDGQDEVVFYCPVCAEREFLHD
jgi:hypothetical protein